mmetsp:Transcript_21353/g.53252  ORF Transcript_21353/g.53252 Transcript_21353/m.53252 type:complete len:233 (-) Transcript_21353:403-1101(-)
MRVWPPARAPGPSRLLGTSSVHAQRIPLPLLRHGGALASLPRLCRHPDVVDQDGRRRGRRHHHLPRLLRRSRLPPHRDAPAVRDPRRPSRHGRRAYPGERWRGARPLALEPSRVLQDQRVPADEAGRRRRQAAPRLVAGLCDTVCEPSAGRASPLAVRRHTDEEGREELWQAGVPHAILRAARLISLLLQILGRLRQHGLTSSDELQLTHQASSVHTDGGARRPSQVRLGSE